MFRAVRMDGASAAPRGLWLVVAGLLIASLAGPFVARRDSAAAQVASGRSSDGLLDILSQARVSYGEHQCSTWTGNRWDCGLRAWEWVGRYRGRLTHDGVAEWRPCIWAHPRTERGREEPLRIVFEDVPLGTALTGEAGLLDAPRTGGPAMVTVRVDGKQRARVRITDGDGRRWHEWRATVPEGLERGDVAFEITAANADWRQVCFTAFVEGAP